MLRPEMHERTESGEKGKRVHFWHAGWYGYKESCSIKLKKQGDNLRRLSLTLEMHIPIRERFYS